MASPLTHRLARQLRAGAGKYLGIAIMLVATMLIAGQLKFFSEKANNTFMRHARLNSTRIGIS